MTAPALHPNAARMAQVIAEFLQMRELCEFVVEPVDLMGDDRYVVFLLHLQGGRPDGRTLDQKQMNAWRFEDGLCVEGWFLPDSTADWDAFSR